MKILKAISVLVITSFIFTSCSTKEVERRSEFLSKNNITDLKLIGDAHLNADKVYLSLNLEGNSEPVRLNTGDHFEIKHGTYQTEGQNSSFSFKHEPDEFITVKLYFEELGLAQHFIVPPFDNLNNLSITTDNHNTIRLEFSNLNENPTEVQLSLKCIDIKDSTNDNYRAFEVIETTEDNIGKIDFSKTINAALEKHEFTNCTIKAEVEKSTMAEDFKSIIGKSTLEIQNSAKDSLVFIPQK
jgi:hypothetical protein